MDEDEVQSRFSMEDPFELESACIRYLDGVISAEDLSQLNALLADDGAARDRFVEICVQTRELREILAARRALAPEAAHETDFQPSRFEAILVELANQGSRKARSNEQALPEVTPAKKEISKENSPAQKENSPAKGDRPAAEKRPLSFHPSRRFLAMAAAVLLAASIALVLSLRGRSAATLTGVAGVTWAPADAVALGSMVESGKLVHLESGAVEFKFASGASVVVEGPAAFGVTGRNEAVLEYGKIVAHVPAPAHGFSVHTAAMTVTDLGTEFGLNVTRSGEAQVEVFTGVVEVGNAMKGAAPATRLTAGEAVKCDLQSSQIRTADQGTIAFARNLSQVRVPLVLHGTGVAAADGGPDPYWQIVSESANPTFVPQPAVAINIDDLDALFPDDERSKWISADSAAPTVPTGDYIFKTSVDLTSVDPNTAQIRLRFWVDDEVRDIRVNGQSNHIDPWLRGGNSAKGSAVTLGKKSGFKAGVNDIEFVVWNDVRRMALRVEWDGTAVPLAEK
jgi:hypothetical protein